MMFYVNYLELANEVDAGRIRGRNLSTRLVNSAFSLTDREFIKTYRLTKDLVRSLIDEIGHDMPVSLRSDGIDTETKILVALAFYATGSYQTIVGQSRSHAISQPSVSRAIRQVTDVLNRPHIFNKYVKFPSSREDREIVKRGFYRKFGMPGVLGCLDGTHVAIVPPVLHEERFFNRKGYHSLNTLIICDSDAKIMCVDSSNPGSTHDSAAWTNNPLNNTLNNIVRLNGEDFYLLGDSGFPLRRTLITPILNAAPNTPESFFTQKHASARNVVERCIGILKGRFRCLHVDRKLHYHPRVAAKIVNACSVLHNIALKCNILNALNAEYLEGMEQEISNIDGGSDNGFTPVSRSRISREPLQQGRLYQERLVQQLWRDRL